jgi:hypothetical protein
MTPKVLGINNYGKILGIFECTSFVVGRVRRSDDLAVSLMFDTVVSVARGSSSVM